MKLTKKFVFENMDKSILSYLRGEWRGSEDKKKEAVEEVKKWYDIACQNGMGLPTWTSNKQTILLGRAYRIMYENQVRSALSQRS
jgi:hypothetical protein